MTPRPAFAGALPLQMRVSSCTDSTRQASPDSHLGQGTANAIVPGKRPLSSMSPTIISRDGQVVMVIGSPGGARIITITLEAIINVIDHGMSIQEAIDAPRIHHQWLPDKVYMDPSAPPADTMKLQTEMGHDVAVDRSWMIWGQAAGILVGGKNLAEIEE